MRLAKPSHPLLHGKLCDADTTASSARLRCMAGLHSWLMYTAASHQLRSPASAGRMPRSHMRRQSRPRTGTTCTTTPCTQRTWCSRSARCSCPTAWQGSSQTWRCCASSSLQPCMTWATQVGALARLAQADAERMGGLGSRLTLTGAMASMRATYAGRPAGQGEQGWPARNSPMQMATDGHRRTVSCRPGVCSNCSRGVQASVLWQASDAAARCRRQERLPDLDWGRHGPALQRRQRERKHARQPGARAAAPARQRLCGAPAGGRAPLHAPPHRGLYPQHGHVRPLRPDQGAPQQP